MDNEHAQLFKDLERDGYNLFGCAKPEPEHGAT